MGEMFEEGVRPGAPEPFRMADTYNVQASETRPGAWSFESVRPNAEPINAVAHDNSAFVNADLDADLELRRAALAARNRNLYYTSFAIAVSRRYLGVDRGQMMLDLRPTGVEHIDIGNVRVRTDDSATLLINFRGGQNAFTRLSFLDVIRGTIPTGIFKDKIVLIGVSDPIAHDIWNTPVGLIPGTEVLAHEIDSILGQCGISDHIEAFVLLIPLMGWGGCWWLGRARPRMILPWTVVILVVFVALETLLFARWGIWLPMVYPALVLLASSLWTIQIRLKTDA
jgi:CHASE2 domain-containing sensor protein